MRSYETKLVVAMALLGMVASLGETARLVCPDAMDAAHHREVMATSAPEIKVRANAQEDGRHWAEIIKPLTQKAIKSAKTLRTTQLVDGIEHGCAGTDLYVGQLVPVADKPSGCDHRVVTRPADADHMWVEVVAICKYDWACCTPEDSKKAGTAGYTLEGPLSGTPASSTDTNTPSTKTKTK